MCFYHDYHWRADINETDEDARDTKPVRCDECHEMIPPGERHVHVYQQQHDEADWDPDEEGEEFNPGETFDYDCCRRCWAFRNAIIAVEEAAGCRGHSAEPALPMLYDEAREQDKDHRREYLERALADSPWIDRAWLERMLNLDEGD
jgi:hypothetical protein